MPGHKAEKARGAAFKQADALIFDLEDAIVPTNKAAAREAALAALSQGGFGAGRLLVLRVNGLGTAFADEDFQVAATLAAKRLIQAVALPKASSRKDLVEARSKLTKLGGPASASVSLWAVIETPLGVLHSHEMAKAAEEVGCTAFVAGTSDLTKELHAQHVPGRTPLLASLSSIVLAARAYNLRALDGVHLALDDEDGFRNTCQQGKELGFDGKTLIHPSQVEEANVTFGPSAEEVAHAKKLVAIWEEKQADKGGGGLVVVDGRLVEHLHVAEARDTIAMADAIAARSIEK